MENVEDRPDQNVEGDSDNIEGDKIEQTAPDTEPVEPAEAEDADDDE